MISTRWWLTKVRLAVWGSLVLTLAACDDPAPPLRTHEGLLVPENDPSFVGAEVGADTVRLTYSAEPARDPFGAVFVAGSQGDGYLRRVVSGTGEGSYVYLLTTEPAAMAEVVESGRLRVLATDAVDVVEGDADVGGTRAPLRAALSLDEILLDESVGGVPITVRSSGELVFEPDATLDVTFRGFEIERLEAAVRGGLRLNLDVEATVGGSVARSGSTELMGPSFPIRGAIGPLPVVGRVEIVLEIGYEASAEASGTASAGVDVTADAAITVRFEDGAWSDDWTPSLSATGRGPTWTVAADASLRAYVRPILRFVLYGVGGPSFALERSVSFDGRFRPCPPSWSLETGVAAEASVEGSVRVLTFERDFSYELARVERTEEIASGTLDDPACVDGGFDAGEEEPDAALPDAGPCEVDAGPDYACTQCPRLPTEPQDAGTSTEPMYLERCMYDTCECPLGTGCMTIPYMRVCCPYEPAQVGSCTHITCGIGYVSVEEITTDHEGVAFRACLCTQGYTPSSRDEMLPADWCIPPTIR